MSDYMFMLENHLSSQQSKVVSEVVAAAADANVNVFLAGGAVRDMLGGFPIRDLDFTVEGNAVKLAKTIAHKTGATITSIDENRKAVELVFEGGVTAEIGMARQERFAKPGGKPHVTPATIHEDLRGRDFTVNAVALSLNKASRGLLLDPTNGIAELEQKELRATGNYTLYDSPIRLFRLLRFKVRLGYKISERTQSQYENARQAEVEKYIGARQLYQELTHIAHEPNPGEVLQILEQEKLLALVSPALTGTALNLAGFTKLHKARQILPFGVDLGIDEVSLFFYLLTEKLAPKERSALIANIGMEKAECDKWQKLETRAKKAEKDLMSASLQRPSKLYHAASKISGELLVFLLVKSTQRLVLDRIRNYFQKYVPAAMEVTDQDVIAKGGVPGTPKFAKLKDEMISAHLDARPKKVAPPPEEIAPPQAAPVKGAR